MNRGTENCTLLKRVLGINQTRKGNMLTGTVT